MPDYPKLSPPGLRLRHWLHDRVLSGDIAIGTGGRKGRTETTGDNWSHFDVVFHYPNDVHVSFSSCQFGKANFEASERFFGTRGSSISPYAGAIEIVGDDPWTWNGSDKNKPGQFSVTGNFSDNLSQADSEKHADFIRSIVSGKFHNQAALGAESALTAMLGRTAAYTGKEANWDDLLRSTETWDAGLDLDRIVAEAES